MVPTLSSARAALLAGALGVLGLPLGAQTVVPYPPLPDWTSADTEVATGCALADLDNDGWLDLVVANGNDINRERVTVYYNDGDGSFPPVPDWSSGDVDYHGHVSVGDVDGDGWLDVAVSVFLGPAGFSQKGRAKLYANDGAGTLSSLPVWSSQDSFYSFSLALGDADGDGDLDLAVATGEPYSHAPDKNRVYYNQGGALELTPGWLSAESDHSMDVAWGDLDGDGDLDLVFCNAKSPLRAYYSVGGSLQTSAGWTASAPTSPNGNTLVLGDLDRDGALDLVFSDNDQLAPGSGRFLAYLGTGSGLAATPAWQSQFVGYTSGVTLCDVDGDGWQDVLGGSWWGALRVYPNAGGTLGGTPAWISSTSSVVEAIPLGDADNSAHFTVLGETHAGDGARQAFRFERTPVVSVEELRADGAPLAADQYCFDAESGWISLASAPLASLSIDYTATRSPDFAVSNWDGGLGNYLFYRRDLLAEPYCFGDGSGAACACGNASAPGAGEGCANSSGAGGLAVAGGTSSASADDLTVSAAQLLHGQPALLFAGESAVGGGAGLAFGDGLRCAGQNVVRLGVATPDAGGAAAWGPGLGALAGWSAGDTRTLQVWYRDPLGPCSSGFNLSNGIELELLP